MFCASVNRFILPMSKQQSLCAPSRNSMLTSRRPDTLHLYDTHSYWRKTVGNYTTIPQYFRGHGYQTYSIGKVFHPGASSNFSDDYPLSWSQPTFHPSTEAHTNEAVCSDAHDTAYRRNLVCPVHVRWQPGRTLPDIQSVAEAERLIAAAKQNGAPYFIAIGLHKPHIPYRYPAHFRRYHAIEKFQWADSEHIRYGMPTVAFNPFNDLRKRDDVRQLNVSFPFGPIDKHFAWKIRQSYYASVTYVDDLIGRLLAGVSLSDTIVVLTGDHGYSLGEHAEWAKYTNYEVGVRVPLIVYSPAFDRRPPLARRSSRIAELVDVFPTLVDLAELPAIERCAALAPSARQTCTEGKSLTPSIWRGSDANDASDEFAISQYPRPGSYPTQWPDSDQPRLGDITIMGYSIRTDNFRYTIWLAFSPESFVRGKCKPANGSWLGGGCCCCFCQLFIPPIRTAISFVRGHSQQIGAGTLARSCTITASMATNSAIWPIATSCCH